MYTKSPCREYPAQFWGSLYCPTVNQSSKKGLFLPIGPVNHLQPYARSRRQQNLQVTQKSLGTGNWEITCQFHAIWHADVIQHKNLKLIYIDITENIDWRDTCRRRFKWKCNSGWYVEWVLQMFKTQSNSAKKLMGVLDMPHFPNQGNYYSFAWTSVNFNPNNTLAWRQYSDYTKSREV